MCRWPCRKSPPDRHRGQFGGINDLAQAGILSGKRVSYIDDFVEDNVLFEAAVHSGAHGIVRDDNIITSKDGVKKLALLHHAS